MKKSLALFLVLCMCFTLPVMAVQTDEVSLDEKNVSDQKFFSSDINITFDEPQIDNVIYGKMSMIMSNSPNVIKYFEPDWLCYSANGEENIVNFEDSFKSGYKYKLTIFFYIEENYQFKFDENGSYAGKILINGKPYDGKTDFVANGMMGPAMTITVTYNFGADEEDIAENPFIDVASDAYYYDAVLWALESGVTTGATATTFDPVSTCTRGQVVTFLWRAKGCPEPKTTQNPFTDVKESDYFYKPVLWAYENGITTGATETTFAPAATCTSAQVVTFLWRSNDKPAAEHTGTEYYAEPVAWANENGLLAGTAVEFAPNNLSPRADIVTYLYRNAMNQQ